MTSVQALFAEALRHHEAGRQIEAERFYRQILQAAPRHADALHMYGVLYLQVGRPDIAVDLLTKAIAQNDGASVFHSHLGYAFQLLGNLTEAAIAYGRVLALREDDAEAHYNLGIIAQAQGEPTKAERSYRWALAHKPDFAGAYCNLGNVRQELGKPAEAVAAYQQALIHKPDFAEAFCNRGNALQAQGDLEAAIFSLQRALTLNADLAGAQCNLGHALQEQGNLAGAVAAYQRALIGSPDLAEAYCSLGSAHRDLGHFDSAKANYRRAIAVVPGNAKFHYGLAEIKRFEGADDAQLVMMETQLAAIDELPADGQSHLSFALAKAYDDLGARGRSFGHLLEGNAKKRGLIRYDEPSTLALFERIQKIFTADLLDRKSVATLPGDGPIFIVGMPRSGTSLIEQILASHGQVFGAGELPLFERTMTAFAGKGAFPELVADLSVENLHHLGAHYRAALRRRSPEGIRITDKLPQNFLYCGLIHLALPDARIIHARRNPIDTCLSCFSKLFTSGHPYSYDLAELGRYYRHYAGLMEHWRRVLPDGVLLEVAYEDMVGDLEGQTRRILDHCGLDWDDTCLDFDRTERPVRTASATQVRQPIYTSSVGRWRPDSALLKPLIDELP